MKTLFISLRLFLLLTLATGVGYPALMLLVGQTVFPVQAGGSLILRHNAPVGSVLLAQKFSQPGYFHPRPSASDYETLPSGASNLSPSSASLRETVAARRAAGLSGEMLFSSAGGLDPDISPQSALAQVPRILAARGALHEAAGVPSGGAPGAANGSTLDSVEARPDLQGLIRSLTEPPFLGFLGQERVNVLRLNLALDAMTKD